MTYKVYELVFIDSSSVFDKNSSGFVSKSHQFALDFEDFVPNPEYKPNVKYFPVPKCKNPHRMMKKDQNVIM